jgi:hypothetical protein
MEAHMAEKYERWNKWAPRYIADYMHDFGLQDWQASAFPGNFAAESGYFNSLQEINPLVPGSRGGLGHPQYTGPRRRAFEAWLKRKGWKVDSYEGNYSQSFRELKGLVPGIGFKVDIIQRLKQAKSLENAVWIVGQYYESPLHLNLAPRIKGAKEALALYRKNPPEPTQWETDNEEEVIVPTPTTPPSGQVISPVPIAVDTSRAAIPWFKSLTFTGGTGSLGASIYALSQAYKPGVPILNQLDVLVPLAVTAIGSAAVVIGRVTSTAQPLTTTQAKADERTEAKIAATAAVAATNVQAGVDSTQQPPPLSPEERAQGWTTVRPEDIPMDALPLNKVRHEINDVADSVLDIMQGLARLSPLLGVLGTVGKVAEAAREASQPAKEGERS